MKIQGIILTCLLFFMASCGDYWEPDNKVPTVDSTINLRDMSFRTIIEDPDLCCKYASLLCFSETPNVYIFSGYGCKDGCQTCTYFNKVRRCSNLLYLCIKTISWNGSEYIQCIGDRSGDMMYKHCYIGKEKRPGSFPDSWSTSELDH